MGLPDAAPGISARQYQAFAEISRSVSCSLHHTHPHSPTLSPSHPPLARRRDEDGKPLVPPEIPSLSSSLLPGAAPNQPALIALAEAPLAPALDTLYGSWAVAHLNLARAGLLLRLGGFPHLWKATHPQTGGWLRWWLRWWLSG